MVMLNEIFCCTWHSWKVSLLLCCGFWGHCLIARGRHASFPRSCGNIVQVNRHRNLKQLEDFSEGKKSKGHLPSQKVSVFDRFSYTGPFFSSSRVSTLSFALIYRSTYNLSFYSPFSHLPTTYRL